jgi:hypothetical protein
MNWDDETAADEYGWLRLMSLLKYDGYRDYLAGVRFDESLAGWLQQFEPADRSVAYQFIRRRLVYISNAEVQRLVERFYPRVVEPTLIKVATSVCNIPRYMIWGDPAAIREMERLRRRTLSWA